MAHPGQVVTIVFPGAQDNKPRPAVIVSTDQYHQTRPDVILGLLTSNLALANHPTDYVLRDWQAAGLLKASAFRAFPATRPRNEIRREVGDLTPRDWQAIQARLRVALAVT